MQICNVNDVGQWRVILRHGHPTCHEVTVAREVVAENAFEAEQLAIHLSDVEGWEVASVRRLA